MNAHPISDDDLHRFVDGRLDPTRQTEVGAYLEAHPDVARRVEGYRRQRDMLRAALAPVAEEPLPPQLDLAGIIEAHRRPSLRPVWGIVAAAAVLFCLGLAGGWWLHDLTPAPTSGVTALAHEATETYAVYAPDHVRPVELRATDQRELRSWVSQRLGRPVPVPDLANSGYRFMGGRLVATAHGPAALFMYDDDHGTRLVVLTRPMAVEGNTAMSPVAEGDVNGYAWSAQGLGYSLVGRAPAQILHRLADEVRRQAS